MIEKFLMKLCIKLLGLRIKHYQNLLDVGGQKSWVETRKGTRIAFICQSGKVWTW